MMPMSTQRSANTHTESLRHTCWPSRHMNKEKDLKPPTHLIALLCSAAPLELEHINLA